ncbi:hypothetical protein [Paenibacillus ferrarius]|uniref:hypothetical protein n=1 Tax=Paenibacillus ferrarius TaxID=1469647 RepID=UPI001301D315|nr:hypothetical protein [Paenibacillus ferrarius]
MSFMIIGKGSYTEDTLIEKLLEWKISDAARIVKEVRQKGSAFVANYRIYRINM